MEQAVPLPVTVRPKRTALGLGLALALGLVMFIGSSPRTFWAQAGAALVTSSAVRPPLLARAGMPAMMAAGRDAPGVSKGSQAKRAPSGPFGGSKKPGTEGGWIGDQSRGVQIGKFERGDDYLFFQGPAPKTAVQDDLPDFFSKENFEDAEVKPLQLLVTGTGLAAAGALAAGLAAPDIVEKLR